MEAHEYINAKLSGLYTTKEAAINIDRLRT
jgi:hypothetical protein